MEEVTVRNKKTGEELILSFPADWNELKPHQLLYIGKYWEAWQSLIKMNESLLKVRAALVIEICNLNSRKEKEQLCNMLALVNEKSGGNILSVCDFIFENLGLTKNLIPKIKVSYFTWYHGPGDRLKDISFDEFSFAFDNYTLYRRTNVEMHLDHLIACLYRPFNDNYKHDGERREEFNNKKIEQYALRTQKIPDEYKQAVYLFFSGCLEYLEKKHPLIFRRQEKGQKAQGKFFDTVISMSGGKFGPLDSTRKTNLYVALRELDQLIKEHEEMKKRK